MSPMTWSLIILMLTVFLTMNKEILPETNLSKKVPSSIKSNEKMMKW